MVNEHAIRAVATLRSGDRLIANSRTASVEFAEAVDVDVDPDHRGRDRRRALRQRPQG